MAYRLLLADDSLTIQKVVELTFSDTEYELQIVGNGDKAMEALQQFEPDVVLADAVMPGVSGYDVCEAVKRLPNGGTIPVILLTGTFEPFDRARADRAGCDAIVTKPFDSHALAAQVKDLVERSQEARRSAPPPAPAFVPEPVPSLGGGEDFFDRPDALYATTALRIPTPEELERIAREEAELKSTAFSAEATPLFVSGGDAEPARVDDAFAYETTSPIEPMSARTVDERSVDALFASEAEESLLGAEEAFEAGTEEVFEVPVAEPEPLADAGHTTAPIVPPAIPAGVSLEPGDEDRFDATVPTRQTIDGVSAESEAAARFDGSVFESPVVEPALEGFLEPPGEAFQEETTADLLTDQPFAEEPLAEPMAEEPMAEEPMAEEPMREVAMAEAAAEEPFAEPLAEGSLARAAEPWAEEMAGEPMTSEGAVEPLAETPAEEPLFAEPMAEDPMFAESLAEESGSELAVEVAADEPVASEPLAEEPFAEAAAEPLAEEPFAASASEPLAEEFAESASQPLAEEPFAAAEPPSEEPTADALVSEPIFAEPIAELSSEPLAPEPEPAAEAPLAASDPFAGSVLEEEPAFVDAPEAPFEEPFPRDVPFAEPLDGAQAFAAPEAAPFEDVLDEPAEGIHLGSGEEPEQGDIVQAIQAYERAAGSDAETGPATVQELLEEEAAVPEPTEVSELEALAANAQLADLKRMIPSDSRGSDGRGGLSEQQVDAIARRVVELLGDRIVREVAWEVVPEMAERIVRSRLAELEG